MAVTTDNPWIDSDRSDASDATPLVVASIGTVTSASTCSGARPGASVWITTCGGTKSGNTSSFAWSAAFAPQTSVTAASAIAIPRNRRESSTARPSTP